MNRLLALTLLGMVGLPPAPAPDPTPDPEPDPTPDPELELEPPAPATVLTADERMFRCLVYLSVSRDDRLTVAKSSFVRDHRPWMDLDSLRELRRRGLVREKRGTQTGDLTLTKGHRLELTKAGEELLEAVNQATATTPPSELS